MGADILHIGDGDLNEDGKLIMTYGFSIYPTISILGEISNLLTKKWPFATAMWTYLMPITPELEKIITWLIVFIPSPNIVLAKNDDIINSEVLGVWTSQALLNIFPMIFCYFQIPRLFPQHLPLIGWNITTTIYWKNTLGTLSDFLDHM